MSKINLSTKNHGIISLDGDDILTNNVVFPFAYNPHNVKLYVIGHEYGAIVALWAGHEQEALDEMVDQNYEQFVIPPEDFANGYQQANDSCVYLGNASEPCNLDYAWLDEVIIDTASRDGLNLVLSFAVAFERGEDNLANAEYN